MFDFLFSSDPKQALRMKRHLAAVMSMLVFTLVSIFFYYHDLYSIDRNTFDTILIFFWVGVFIYTAILRSGLNKRYHDPSLTIPQMLWGATYILTIAYLLNDWRGLILMSFFGMLSFGFFKLNFREFLSIGLYAVLGYALIIIYLFLNEPERIEINLELMQLLAFASTITVMMYTGSAIHRLRNRTKKQYVALQEALELNKKLAITDDLTGLYNRHYFMEKLSQQKALSERNDSDFVVFYCDLDHFKHINDTFGHHTGDIVLQKFSEILLSSIREIDYAARFGGEEFVCLLVNTDIENAKKVTERIRQSLATYNFSDIAPSLNSTVSIGIANFKEFKTIQETLMSADNRMYSAKQLGRNKVVFSDEAEDAADTKI
ncbi:MAG: GGDEF domain-containing protein [Proteobacteria bacterium]|nr:GGDEF domain-containing protein [Pseudomonadota bacterium]